MLVILSTHPIQYQAPIWKMIAARGRVPVQVWYMSAHGIRASLDRQFQQVFSWDIDTLEGYEHRLLDGAERARPDAFWHCAVPPRFGEDLVFAGAKALWIQGWQVRGYWQAVLAARRAGIPVWLRAESNDLRPVPAWKKPLKRAVLSRFFGAIDQFLYIGAGNRRLYESYGVPRDRLHFAPYAVDNARFAHQARMLRPLREDIRREWRVPEDAFCVLFCGKFIEKKRPFDLIDAALAMARQGYPGKVHLLFAGSGPLGDDLRRRCAVAFDAENRGIVSTAASAPSASFVGFLNQTEVSRAYVAADCLALPSDYGETWGLVVNEALASGVPAVASRQCGCAEDLVARRWPARVFATGNPFELAESLADVASDPQAKPDAHPDWLDGYDMETVVDLVERLYARK